jgi:hypothetical protein
MKIKLSALDREIRANPGNSKRINAPFYAPKHRDMGALLVDFFTGRIAEENLILVSVSAAIWVYSGALLLLGALMGEDIFWGRW